MRRGMRQMNNKNRIDSEKLVIALKRKLGVQTDAELAVFLGTSTATVRNWLTWGVTEDRLANAFISAMKASRIAEGKKIANDTIASLYDRLSVSATDQLAGALGVSVGTIGNWTT